MQLFIGLGNPGTKYRHTRHNMGFTVIDNVQEMLKLSWKEQKGLQALVASSKSYVLAKPQTFMNASGLAVKAIAKHFDYSALGKKDFSSVFLVYDDLDLETGKYKFVFGSGPKVHNGVNSVKEQLGTDQFWHVRIGVDSRGGNRSIPPEEYVLSGFRDEEQELVDSVVDGVASFLIEQMEQP